MKSLVATLALVSTLSFASTNAHAFDTAHVPGTPFAANELKSFVYYWFSLFDRSAPVERYLEVLQDQGLDLRLPGAAMKSHADFRNWYAGILGAIKTAAHDIEALSITEGGDGAYRVELTVRWTAEAYDGSHPDLLVHQIWRLEDQDGATPVITQLVGEAIHP